MIALCTSGYFGAFCPNAGGLSIQPDITPRMRYRQVLAVAAEGGVREIRQFFAFSEASLNRRRVYLPVHLG